MPLLDARSRRALPLLLGGLLAASGSAAPPTAATDLPAYAPPPGRLVHYRMSQRVHPAEGPEEVGADLHYSLVPGASPEEESLVVLSGRAWTGERGGRVSPLRVFLRLGPRGVRAPVRTEPPELAPGSLPWALAGNVPYLFPRLGWRAMREGRSWTVGGALFSEDLRRPMYFPLFPIRTDYRWLGWLEVAGRRWVYLGFEAEGEREADVGRIRLRGRLEVRGRVLLDAETGLPGLLLQRGVYTVTPRAGGLVRTLARWEIGRRRRGGVTPHFVEVVDTRYEEDFRPVLGNLGPDPVRARRAPDLSDLGRTIPPPVLRPAPRPPAPPPAGP